MSPSKTLPAPATSDWGERASCTSGTAGPLAPLHTLCTGAGLGGGSANAATALWAANQLAGCPATNQELLDWSGTIGSDISVFFSQGAAYCTGRCEAPVCVGCKLG